MPVPPRFQSIRQSPLLSSPSVSPLLSAAQWINYLHVCAYIHAVHNIHADKSSQSHSLRSFGRGISPVPSRSQSNLGDPAFIPSQSVSHSTGRSECVRSAWLLCALLPPVYTHTQPRPPAHAVKSVEWGKMNIGQPRAFTTEQKKGKKRKRKTAKKEKKDPNP